VAHHVFDREAVLVLRCARHEFKNLFFERVECGQRGQAALLFGQLQKPEIDVGWILVAVDLCSC